MTIVESVISICTLRAWPRGHEILHKKGNCWSSTKNPKTARGNGVIGIFSDRAPGGSAHMFPSNVTANRDHKQRAGDTQ